MYNAAGKGSPVAFGRLPVSPAAFTGLPYAMAGYPSNGYFPGSPSPAYYPHSFQGKILNSKIETKCLNFSSFRSIVFPIRKLRISRQLRNKIWRQSRRSRRCTSDSGKWWRQWPTKTRETFHQHHCEPQSFEYDAFDGAKCINANGYAWLKNKNWFGERLFLRPADPFCFHCEIFVFRFQSYLFMSALDDFYSNFLAIYYDEINYFRCLFCSKSLRKFEFQSPIDCLYNGWKTYIKLKKVWINCQFFKFTESGLQLWHRIKVKELRKDLGQSLPSVRDNYTVWRQSLSKFQRSNGSLANWFSFEQTVKKMIVMVSYFSSSPEIWCKF